MCSKTAALPVADREEPGIRILKGICVIFATFGLLVASQGLGLVHAFPGIESGEFSVGLLIVALTGAGALAGYLLDKQSVRRALAKYGENIRTGYSRLHCPDQRTFEADADGFVTTCRCGSVRRPWSELSRYSENDRFFLLESFLSVSSATGDKNFALSSKPSFLVSSTANHSPQVRLSHRANRAPRPNFSKHDDALIVVGWLFVAKGMPTPNLSPERRLARFFLSLAERGRESQSKDLSSFFSWFTSEQEHFSLEYQTAKIQKRPRNCRRVDW